MQNQHYLIFSVSAEFDSSLTDLTLCSPFLISEKRMELGMLETKQRPDAVYGHIKSSL